MTETSDHETRMLSLLTEIRDQQREALTVQREQAELAREQLERSRRAVEESITLQRQALEKQKGVMRIALPGIALCIALIAWLIFRYL